MTQKARGTHAAWTPKVISSSQVLTKMFFIPADDTTHGKKALERGRSKSKRALKKKA
jgi:hypothetical protein